MGRRRPFRARPLPGPVAVGIVALVLASLVSYLRWAGREPLPPPGERHVSDVLGLSLRVPVGWEVAESDGRWTDLRMTPGRPRGHGAGVSIVVMDGPRESMGWRARAIERPVALPAPRLEGATVEVASGDDLHAQADGVAIRYVIRFDGGRVLQLHSTYMTPTEGTLASWMPLPSGPRLKSWLDPIVESIRLERGSGAAASDGAT